MRPLIDVAQDESEQKQRDGVRTVADVGQRE